MTLGELGDALGLSVRGDRGRAVAGVRDIERLGPDEALDADRVYFVETPAVLKRHPRATEGGVVLTVPALAEKFADALVAPEGGARPAFIALLKRFDRTPSFPPGVHPRAFVDATAKVDPSASVLAGAVVMADAVVGARCVLYPGVVIEPSAAVGDDTVLYPGVVLGHHCRIGRRGIVHGAAVIGADGFGFHDDKTGRHKVPQIGTVEIGDDVEIGSGCTIDRATIETTSIGAQTKLDDQVHVAHNCRLGRFIYVAANSGLAGSVVVEDGVMISGMVSVLDHVRLAKGTIVMGMSGVARDTEPKTAYFGTPARPARQTHKMNAALERLPELLARVRELEARLGISSFN